MHNIIKSLKKVYSTIHNHIILTNSNHEKKFSHIYNKNYWGCDESKSGPGSTLSYTENIRKELPIVLSKFNINYIFDAPCGDFHWMKLIDYSNKQKYVGGDIVPSLIDHLTLNYSQHNINFIKIDIRTDHLPESDLMICRDCLFHFSNDDILLFFNNFIKSNIKYLLTSNHINIDKFKNIDILTGDFRKIDLFSPPFNIINNPLYRFNDWIEPYPQREMLLISRDQLKTSLGF